MVCLPVTEQNRIKARRACNERSHPYYNRNLPPPSNHDSPNPRHNLRNPSPIGAQMNRRNFLISLFGTAAVAAAGPIPKALTALSDNEFVATIKAALPRNDEIYRNGKDYAFAKIEWIAEPPYVKVSIPEGFRPLREESDRLGSQAIADMQNNPKKYLP